MLNLATAVAATHGIQSGQVLGALGAGGAALASTVVLILGIKGKHKIRFDQHQAAIGGLIAGELYATAAVGIWAAPGSIAQGIAQAVQHGIGGNVGMGAVALSITAIIYGARLRPGLAAFLGITAATVYTLAGGVWGLGTAVLSSGLNQVLGA